jgi:hypothetical protein
VSSRFPLLASRLAHPYTDSTLIGVITDTHSHAGPRLAAALDVAGTMARRAVLRRKAG